MDNDDAILSQILKTDAAQRRVRPSFAQDVIRRLPERKRATASRRTLLLTTFALGGSCAASALAWSDLMRFATGFAQAMNEVNALQQSLASLLLASPLAFLAALLAVLYYIAKRAKLI